MRTFSTAAEMLSFTRAADELELTQGAVSQHIAALEKGLQTKLFSRSGRSVELTDDGRQFYDYARRIVDLADEAVQALSGGKKSIRGTIRIAASSVPAETLLPQLLAEFRQCFPDVRESVEVTDSAKATQAIESGQADVALVGELPRASSLQVEAIATDELALVVSPRHRFAKKGTATLQQLSEESLIVREPGSGSRRCVENALEQKGVMPSKLNIAMEFNSNDAIRSAVEQDAGVAFLSIAAIGPLVDSKKIAQIKIRGFHPRRHLYRVSDPRRVASPVVREFLSFLDDYSPQIVTGRT